MKVASSLTFVLLLALVAADPVPPPTMEQIQADFQAQQYQEVIKKVAQALPLSTRAGSNYDRGELFKLKAESHLRLKQWPLAADAFNMAAKESTGDPAAVLKSTGTLVRRSNNGVYSPKQPTTQPSAGGKPAPIDIVDPNSRKQALNALFNDEAKVQTAKIESTKKATTLPPVMAAIKQMSELRDFEIAGTGADNTCKQLLSTLGSHANTLMGSAMKTMAAKVEQISKQANEARTEIRDLADGTRETVTYKRGLTSVDTKALKEVISTCQSIAKACDEFTEALAADAGAFTGTRTEADRLGARADDVLRANYEPVVGTTGGGVIIRRGGSTNPPANTPR